MPSALPLGPDRGGELAGGEVGHGRVNMLRESSIGLTSDLLVAVVRPEKSPASGGGGAAAARPRGLGRRRGKGLGSTTCCTGSLHVA
jgi:hypothetical protein